MYASAFGHPRARRCFAMSRGRHGWYGHGTWAATGSSGRRARRGDVRSALLLLLAEEPRNGYQLMQEIEQRSEGIWRPSPGSIYPALQQLEDERLVRTAERDGARVYEITDAGRDWLAARPSDAEAPWDAVKEGVGDGPRDVMNLVREVAVAASQIVRAGDDAQLARAQEQLREARRSLYRILADDED